MNNFIIASILLLITSCQKTKNIDNFDYGTIKGQTYFNNYFKASIKLPNDWTILTGKDFTKFIESSVMENSNNKKELSEAIKASEINRAELLALINTH
ncbi:hypothetical protein [Mangrovimonas sp. TPBH4]|uniref:hypothetical protein n=1 Tax=Mangrovimonas sp. TPBH4 TaxID=1645914 RepID=UPI0006B5E481|nr:hypothetical protein [Mangrovimonas sp. TPBH4]